MQEPTLTELLQFWRSGGPAAQGEVLEQTYRELHRIAAALLGYERVGHTLSASDLLNEAFLEKLRDLKIPPQNRGHFYSLAARAMRQVLVDYARRHQSQKRTPGVVPGAIADSRLDDDALDLNLALDELRLQDAAAANIVELRHYLGMTIEEIAELLAIDVHRVRNDWEFAKVWLRQKLGPRP